ncbi:MULTISPECIES: DUF6694 family lipoprotein [Psychrilyobacter]|uniref:Uncharacterized protein n=1 Tax=Psychrilyobacter piezotolerans TaxID=2293438 RepID=A0ABX9KJJ7_9FUSO|nr:MULTISPECIES: DUF6694 family lipoprotein [Psychrilyobacter]MCS5422828.1 hypothetical protein [Psychrilyobacter sp. S5]NDI77179.1 hypothetical protein [Psychrilyobacter piezotolerans]RDE64171.1 hypothetical protein DV867_04375 [Psychrilyobacter sp. S5]REI42263.1 hypothetical protein DYH56_04375 [Psychrilyobacter piezotolerans]
MKKLILMIFMMSLITGFAGNKIDSSTDEKFESSINSIKNSLSDEKKKEFEATILSFTSSVIDNNSFEMAVNPDGVQRKIKDKLHGKTADEVIAQGDLIIAEQKKREQERKRIERKQTLAEIEKIKTEITEFEKKQSEVKKELKKFIVVRSRFYFQEEIFSDDPIIEVTVKNETKHAVSKAYFHGIIASPGRSIPWLKDTFSCKISGGLQPGERVTFKLSPNMLGDWDNVPKDKEDMILTLTTTRIDGADEKSIYDSDSDSEFSEWDNERFEDLKEKLAELQKVTQN